MYRIPKKCTEFQFHSRFSGNWVASPGFKAFECFAWEAAVRKTACEVLSGLFRGPLGAFFDSLELYGAVLGPFWVCGERRGL
eukprot:2719653-Pyramimonas_sp.AAC.1